MARKQELPDWAKETRREVHAYIEGVTSGQIVAGKLVKLAAARHVQDMERGADRGLIFDEAEAARVCQFFGLLKHSKGRQFSGKPFVLSPWQKFIIWNVYGWKRKVNGRLIRRYRVAYLEMARKQGKSTFAAGIGLELLVCDGEPGAEIYTAATKRDQARIVWSEAARMVLKSQALKKHVKKYRDSLVLVHDDGSKFEPLGADSNSTDGLNIHGAIVDELHAHKTRDMWDVIETATGSREQPLIVAITTAGSEEQSICGELHDYTAKVLSGVYADDSWFGFIATLDEGDDWQDEANWAKANPNLGISCDLEDLRRKATKAARLPTARNNFLRLHLNVWTKASVAAIPMEDWNACSDRVDEERLVGRTCHSGLDLSKTSDMTAFVHLFPPTEEGGLWHILPRIWMPEDALEDLDIADQLKVWADQGYLILCDNNRIDFAAVHAQVLADKEKFDIQSIAYDPWNAEQTAQALMKEGCNLKQFAQSISNFNEPTKTLLDMVKQHQFAHGGNPVMKWCASCLEVKVDANNNMRPVKPDQRKTSKRIDPIVALIMATAQATFQPDESLDLRIV